MLFFIFLALNVSVFLFDLKKRIIPNILLVGIFLLKVIMFILDFDVISLFDSLFALVFAFLVFLVPKFFYLKIGWGDVKFSAVLGFYLGFINYIYGMLIAVACIFAFCAVRKFIMQKDIKDFPLPLGSFMSVGAIFICVISQTLRL